jgi:Tetratricopeptide repeat.
MVSSYKKLGIAFSKLNMPTEAIEHFKKGLESMLNNEALSKDLKGLIFFYDQLASLYMAK